MDIHVIKTWNGALMPASEADQEKVRKIKAGEVVRMTLSRVRNYQFLKKYFALLNFAYDLWEPPALPVDRQWTKEVEPEKNFEQFRGDLTILAGFYEAHYRLDGSVRVAAKSISFAAMTEDEFEKLYSAMIDVVLKHICTQYTAEQLDGVLDQVMHFAA